MTYSPEQITSFLLGYLKETAETFLGGVKIEQAVVSVPVYFNESQRQLIECACKLAGLEVEMLISDPLASAIACMVEKGGTILGDMVYLEYRNIFVFYTTFYVNSERITIMTLSQIKLRYIC